MSIALGALLREAAFPLFAIHPRHWSGPAFVGNVARERGGSWLHTVQLVYLDGPDGIATGGALVSNLEAGFVTGERGVKVDPLQEHLLGFVARFEPRFLTRFMRSGATPVEPNRFQRHDQTIMIAGAERGAHRYEHRDLPLTLIRTAVRGATGITDLVVAAWQQSARDLCAIVEPVTEPFAREFDGDPTGGVYPPPDWGLPG